jgi:hypothetical protein
MLLLAGGREEGEEVVYLCVEWWREEDKEGRVCRRDGSSLVCM